MAHFLIGRLSVVSHGSVLCVLLILYLLTPFSLPLLPQGRRLGISSSPGHQSGRDACLNAFVAAFGGRSPLVRAAFADALEVT